MPIDLLNISSGDVLEMLLKKPQRTINTVPKKTARENRLDRSRSKCFILSVDDIVMSARRRGASQCEGAEILLMPLCRPDRRRLRTFRDPLMFPKAIYLAFCLQNQQCILIADLVFYLVER